MVYFVSVSFFQKPVQLQSPFQNTEISYYPVSEYLPPINTGQKGTAKPRKGQPKLAKQEILSLSLRVPDNRQQTIVTPPQVKLNKDVARAEYRGLDSGACGAAHRGQFAVGIAVEDSAVPAAGG